MGKPTDQVDELKRENYICILKGAALLGQNAGFSKPEYSYPPLGDTGVLLGKRYKVHGTFTIWNLAHYDRINSESVLCSANNFKIRAGISINTFKANLKNIPR